MYIWSNWNRVSCVNEYIISTFYPFEDSAKYEYEEHKFDYNRSKN